MKWRTARSALEVLPTKTFQNSSPLGHLVAITEVFEAVAEHHVSCIAKAGIAYDFVVGRLSGSGGGLLSNGGLVGSGDDGCRMDEDWCRRDNVETCAGKLDAGSLLMVSGRARDSSQWALGAISILRDRRAER
jgi:hypothetical protein